MRARLNTVIELRTRRERRQAQIVAQRQAAVAAAQAEVDRCEAELADGRNALGESTFGGRGGELSDVLMHAARQRALFEDCQRLEAALTAARSGIEAASTELNGAKADYRQAVRRRMKVETLKTRLEGQ